jgi:hypothetical protein
MRFKEFCQICANTPAKGCRTKIEIAKFKGERSDGMETRSLAGNIPLHEQARLVSGGSALEGPDSFNA